MPLEVPSLARQKMPSADCSKVAAPKLGVAPQDLETADGIIFVKRIRKRE